MKRIILGIILALFSISAHAQSLTGQLTTASSTCGAAATSSLVLYQSPGTSLVSAAFATAGTWTGTVTFYTTANAGATWSAFAVTPSSGGNVVSTTTSNANFSAPAQGYNGFCATFTTASTGSVSVTITLSSGGGGGGSGSAALNCATTNAVYYQPGVANTAGCSNTLTYNSLTGFSETSSQTGDNASMVLSSPGTGSPFAYLYATDSVHKSDVYVDGENAIVVFGQHSGSPTVAVASAGGTGALSASGDVRLTKSGSLKFRNNANNGDVGLALDGTDDLVTPPISNGGVVTKNVIVTLSSADLLTLAVTPKQLVPAQGANTLIVPQAVTMQYKYLTTAYTLGNADNLFKVIYHGGPAFDAAIQIPAAGMVDQTVNEVNWQAWGGPAGAGVAQTDVANTALDLTLVGTTPALILGAGSLVVTVSYYVITMQ